MAERSYSIGELAAAADATPRTIRYYTAEGLLPPPEIHGRYGRYRHEHLLRLGAIARMKQAFLPLHVIRARLEGLSEAALAQLVAEEHAPALPEPKALEYRVAPSNVTQRVADAPQGYGFAPSASVAAAPGMPTPNQTFIQPAAPTFTPHPPPEQAETWQRLTLAPGVELHLREPASAAESTQIERLLAAAVQIFS